MNYIPNIPIKIENNVQELDIRDIVHIIELRDIEDYVYKQLCQEGRFVDHVAQELFDFRVMTISQELKSRGYWVRASLGKRELLDWIREQQME